MKSQNDTLELSLKFNPNEIFPLRLSPFEEYLYLDDRATLPMTEGSFWIFEGRVDPELLQRALTRVVAYEPLFFVRVVRRYGRLYWDVPKDLVSPKLEVTQISESIVNIRQGIEPLEYFNLKKEALKIRLVVGTDGFALHIPTQHSLVDGCGITRFVGFLFDFYEDELNRARSEKAGTESGMLLDPSILPIPASLKDREKLSAVHKDVPPPPFIKVLRFVVRETFLWFARRPWNITPFLYKRKRRVCGKEKVSRRKTPCIHWHTLPQEDVVRARQYAKKVGVTFNTLLTSVVCIAFEKWRRNFDAPTANRRLRVLVPVNLRQSEQERLPMANLIGYVFLDRFSSRCMEPGEQFLHDLNKQMNFIVEHSVGLCFIAGARFFRNFPFALRFLTSGYFCHSTLVFSNLGQVGYCFAQKRFRDAKAVVIDGELRMLRMISAPPVRPNTPVSIGTISVGNEVTFNFCIDENVVSSEDQEALTNIIFNEINACCKRMEENAK